MPAPAPALRIDTARARSFWHRRQGLAEPQAGSIEEVIARCGWPRTLGGVDVYLALRARVPGLTRRDLDRAVEESRVQVIPAVRGCIYLVPRAEVPLVLKVSDDQSRKRTERELEKAGVEPKELAEIGEEVLKALRRGPLGTDALRRALPEGTVRSLGEKGKKIGISSPLPAALRHLEHEGKVERSLDGGRLDTERYLWRLPKKSPFAGAKVPADATERNAVLAGIFFRQLGPATLKDFASWTALSQRDARAAMDRAPLAPVAIDGYADEAFALEADLPALREKAPAATSLSMLPFEDGYMVSHGGPGILVDPAHHGLRMPVWGMSKETTLGEARHISLRALLDGDRIAGMWEYEPDAKRIVVGTFEPMPARRRRAVDALAEDLAAFIGEELGHGRSFSLDTDLAMKERAALVKRIGR